MFNLSILITLYAGFTHAFETDHLLAVSNLVLNRREIGKAIKDGMFWGLGHTSTILVMGIIILILRFQVSEQLFHYFEAGVGCMLIGLGSWRLIKWVRRGGKIHLHAHQHPHTGHHHPHAGIGHHHPHVHHPDSHLPSYQVGLVHGLAGSGSLILLVIAQTRTVGEAIIYLTLFGLGSVGGMMLAAGMFSLPLTKWLLRLRPVEWGLVVLSSTLCVAYGAWVIYHNIIAA